MEMLDGLEEEAPVNGRGPTSLLTLDIRGAAISGNQGANLRIGRASEFDGEYERHTNGQRDRNSFEVLHRGCIPSEWLPPSA